MVSSEEHRRAELEEQGAVFFNALIQPEKLSSELKSGTSCEQFVLRVLGLSELTGGDKGSLWPDDVYKMLKEGSKIMQKFNHGPNIINENAISG